MSCDDVELELSGPAPSPEALAHAQACPRCAETLRALGLAALPALDEAERDALAGLPEAVRGALASQARPQTLLRRAVGLALAAGVGALVAGVALELGRAPVEPLVRTVHVTPPELPGLQLDEANLSDDEVFFEVGWPSPTEGDL
jgi:hypothetical protein